MFEIKLNEKLVELLEPLRSESSEIGRFLDNGNIPMKSLLALQKQQLGHMQLCEVLHPLEFKFKSRPARGSEYSDSFKKQLDRLRLELNEQEYQEMVKRDGLTTFHDEDNLTPAQMNKQVKEQVTTVFNILVSVVSVVFAAWYWSGSSAGMKPHNRIILCLFSGILILVAEVVVYNSYLRKIDEARKREKSKREVKTVIKQL
ncbi:LAME_0G17194g1_1 [Lachancea meyersii CBS 8951]|uniref:LAME_0G17194g1_1 n=1 Tax=Lachancea meyersii CBS 8951 TaxID=1266667 RepID=A0A1G4KBC3_9SACH|nr:LAME_0G17194g1_1 [Lachancea meyersii CBS 8951]